MEDRRDHRVADKLDAILEKITQITVSIAKIEVDVAHHIKRTDLLEKQVEPMKKHADELSGVVKFFKILALVIGVIEAIRMFH